MGSFAKGEIRGAAVWSALQSWLEKLCSFVSFLVLARILTPSDFGLVALAMVYIGIIQLLSEQGLGQALIQRKNPDEKVVQTAFWLNAGISVLLAAFTVAAAPAIAVLLGDRELSPILRALALPVVINIFSVVPASLLQQRLQFQSLTLRTAVSSLAGMVVAVSLAFCGAGVWSLVAQQIVVSLAGVAVVWTAAAWHPKWIFSIRECPKLFHYGKYVLGASLLNLVTQRSDRLLIGIFLGPQALGYYFFGYELVRRINDILVGSVSRVAMPVFSRIQDDLPHMQTIFLKAIRLASIISVPVFAVVCGLSPFLVPLIFGAQWEPSILVIQILCANGLIWAAFQFHAPVWNALGRPGITMGINALQAVGNLVVFSVSVRWGIACMALAYVLRIYVTAPIQIHYLKTTLGVRYSEYFKALLPSLSAFYWILIPLLIINMAPLSSSCFLLALAAAALGTSLYSLRVVHAAPEVVRVFSSLGSKIPLFRRGV